MKSIKKRFAKLRIVSKMVQYEPETDGGIIGTNEATEETSSLTTDCTVADKNGKLEIEYEESELTGMEGSTTRLFFDTREPGLVSLLREGSVSSAFVFEAGRRHICTYNTPYFPIELCVDTVDMQNSLTYQGGSFHASYVVEMNGVLAERADVNITLLN